MCSARSACKDPPCSRRSVFKLISGSPGTHGLLIIDEAIGFSSYQRDVSHSLRVESEISAPGNIRSSLNKTNMCKTRENMLLSCKTVQRLSRFVIMYVLDCVVYFYIQLQ